MTATIVFFHGRPASHTEELIVGSILLLCGLTPIYLVIRHWDWMQKSWWRKGTWGRLGHCYGGATLVIFGTLVIADSQKIWPADMGDYCAVGFVLWAIVGACLFLRDYFRHLDNKDG